MLVIILLIFVASTSSKTLPPGIKKCRKSDPNLNHCLDLNVMDGVQQFRGGNRELGIVPLEPLVIPLLEFGDDSAGSISLKQHYSDLKIYGGSNLTIFDTKINLDDENCTWYMKTTTKKLIAKANYRMTGRMLLFTINGHGKCEIIMDNVLITYDLKCEKYLKRNKKHIRITSAILELVPEKLVADFGNLIDGNEQLSRQLLKAANDNAMDLFTEVGPALAQAMAKVETDIANQVFSRVPEDEIFLP
ncbi:hypothetical protein Zmor_017263 [Zophobas morio]|uniref:Uncharacterized protein n=1 Tax=Zophobas morio TaxID=2755281 RepID=A0AA38I8G3_9CUCU|nr:hypothetical protein Zmor_017263 [Zophobas morio]